MHTHDLIIIGGGRAATLAVAAGKAGKRVALIERDRLGGTCPNRGCVPSKLLIGYGEAARRVREAKNHFIEAEIKEMGSGVEQLRSIYADKIRKGPACDATDV